MSSTAAVVVHGLVVFALPDVPAEKSIAAPVWMSLIVTGEGPTSAAAMRGHSAADSKSDESQARDTSKRTRAHRIAAHAHAASGFASNAATAKPAHASVEMPAPSAAIATREPGPESERLGAPASLGTAAGAGNGAASSDGADRGGTLRGPSLLPIASPCRRYFPSDAKTDHGQVRIDVHVDASGRARFHRLLAEEPRGHGFGSAAAACASALRFAPALNGAGIAIAGSAKLELRFDRS